MKKPHLLLLPGLLNDDRLWRQQIQGLAKMAEVTVADLSEENSIARLASSALAQIPSGQFALAGMSMGGYVALEIMRQVPGRVSALALLDTTARPDTPEASAKRLESVRLAQNNFPSVVDSLLPKLVHPGHLDDVNQVSVIMSMAYNLGKEAFVRQQKAIIDRIDSRPHLGRIHCPTLILCGREDLITPVELHEEMHSSITGSELRILENCGHLSPLEQPQQVTEALKEWLGRIDFGISSLLRSALAPF